LGALSWASYSTFCNVFLSSHYLILTFILDGRRPVYLVALPLLFLGSLGVASSQTIFQLLLWRFVQAIGASPGIAVGAGVIGDIYKLQERGQALGIFFAVCHFRCRKWGFTAGFSGHSFGTGFGSPCWRYSPFLPIFFCSSYFLPVGFATHYYSWRFMQLLLGLVGFLVFFLILFFLPETYHPNKRGVDNFDPSLLSKWRPVILNPFQPLWLLRSPNLLIVVRILFSSYHFKV
jgi:MFS family permease